MCTKDRLKTFLTFHKNISYCIFIAFTSFYKGHVSWPVGGIFQTPSLIQSFSRDEVNSNVFTSARIMLTPLLLIWTGWELGLVRDGVGSVFRPSSLLSSKPLVLH